MLYVTTRSDRDAYTAQRVLWENRGPDGGLYIPFRNPCFSEAEVDALAEKSFFQCVAELLNLQFNTRLTARDVEFSAGRAPVRLVKLSHRILLGECWHNPDWQFSGLVSGLLAHLPNMEAGGIPGDWAAIGVRIAVLFGIYGELARAGMAGRDRPFDVSLVSGDFSGPISAWYARKWGLPVGNIICCCNENNDIWNLICHGVLRTDGVAAATLTPDADVVVPQSLERLIRATGGAEETRRYWETVRRGGNYYVDDRLLQELRQGIYVTVVSQRRMLSTIPNVYSTTGTVLSPYSSLAHAGLLDYRSRTGESRHALVVSEKSPLRDAETTAHALGIPPEELNQYL